MAATLIATPVLDRAAKMDAVSDAVDEVNVLKYSGGEVYDGASAFDQRKDKGTFRQYDDACDRVKNFYAVRAGCRASSLSR